VALYGEERRQSFIDSLNKKGIKAELTKPRSKLPVYQQCYRTSPVQRAKKTNNQVNNMNERKKRIMEEATKLFSKKGFHATSIQDIVEQSGMSKGSFYNYFQSKEELIISLIKHYQEVLMEKLASIEQNTELNPKEILMKQIQAQLEVLYAHKEFIHIQMTEASFIPSEDLHQLMFKIRANAFNWLCKRITDVYGEQIAPYTFDCATILSGMIKEYLSYVVLDKKDLDLNQMVPFIFRRLDAIVASFSNYEAPLLDEALLKDLIHIRQYEKEKSKKQLLISIEHMRSKLISLDLEKKQSEKIHSSLEALENELFSCTQEPREYIAEGILLYLQNQNIQALQAELEELAEAVKLYVN
jgi:AcrR family transcriptional regulator